MSTIKTGTPEGKNIGFVWWTLYGVLTLTLGSAAPFMLNLDGLVFLTALGVNVLLGVLILMKNKWAFLIGTVLSLNPLSWLINGIYLKNRWNHPEVNGGTSSPTPVVKASRLSTAAVSTTEEEAIYEQAAEEIGTAAMKKGLWAKSLSEVEGDHDKAIARYIKARSQQLIEEHGQRRNEQGGVQETGKTESIREEISESNSLDRERSMNELISRMKQ